MIKGQSKVGDFRLPSRIGYQFKQPELLKLALTHRSVSHKYNYERLEFLGDSLLGMIIANYLYHAYPEENEGRLTRMRATLVRQEALGKIANDLKLSQSMILSTGELKSGGHHRESIMADTVEAIIGAIYVDSADLPVLQKIVLKWYEPYLEHIEPTDQLKDPKSRLQEYLQARKKPLPHYEVVDIQGDAPNQHFKVECIVEDLPTMLGEGSSRRFAEQAVAAQILKLLEQ
ncbi:ribonuclease III [Acinetobacter gerneri]|uniref:Ribonuclease 3 n=2 Tax=Acinetobacter gerneri TaxID=202952 RepID=N8ZNY8_9GAMM|nr:ribonuclease III [Acinetobacter gerneri]ENV33468.1 ribonuclease 3 [Acinetobacter gerneri DSM 14967 = CIP 107464 = MTCC 9824]EPR80297.1 Ribonuclease III [Acinetobacter gerneri DSM 14967 = CIP 107464 = MTCC 9824]MCH4244740.1 ribonuclease III [Acinetobacter gerneri]MDQ9009242.1 ribonuclease III [Acinetobacter gerneri]MDQ9013346.1 ribonuclease III [Acinetobacter gerneri]